MPRGMAGADHLRPCSGCRARAEWSDLPPELLLLIARNLTNIRDYAHFRGVCRSWRSAARPADLPPQLPWLLLPFQWDTTARSFLNLSDGRVYTRDLPAARSKWIFGSSHGWLVMLGGDGVTVTLLNPITRAEILLPPLPPWLQSPYITKVVLSSNPATAADGDGLVAVWAYHKLAFCRLRDARWGVIDVCDSYKDGELAYHAGAFYIMGNADRRVVVHEVGSSSSSSKLSLDLDLPMGSSRHLVETSSGDLLLVASYEVFKLDQGGQPKWTRLDGGSIADTTFFLSGKQSTCISSRDFLGWEGNCIYLAGCRYLEDQRFGLATVADIHRCDLACGGIKKQLYWQASETHWLDWKESTGITWIIPTLL